MPFWNKKKNQKNSNVEIKTDESINVLDVQQSNISNEIELDQVTIDVINNYESDEERDLIYNINFSIGVDIQHDTVLDAGCGTGQFYSWLKKLHHEPLYKGIDHNENAIAFANSENKLATGIPLFDTLDILDCNDRFDWVILNNVGYHYVNSKDEAIAYLESLYAVANKGLSFNLPHGESGFDMGETLKYLVDKYVKVVLRRDYIDGEFTIYIYK